MTFVAIYSVLSAYFDLQQAHSERRTYAEPMLIGAATTVMTAKPVSDPSQGKTFCSMHTVSTKN